MRLASLVCALALFAAAPTAVAAPAYQWAPGGGQAQVAGGLAVRVGGLAGGPPVVFLHGVAGSGRYFGAAYDALGDRARLIAPDLPGCGGSPALPPGRGLDGLAEAVLGALDGLGVREPAVLVGLSLGTTLAIRLAATYPARVAAVVGTAPLVYAGPEAAVAGLRKLDPVTATFATDPAAARFILGWARTHHADAAAIGRAVDPKLPALILDDALRSDPEALVEGIRAGIVEADVPAWIAAARAPIRLLVGGADPTPDRALLAALARRHRHLSVVAVPGADHHVLLSHPEVALAELRRAVTLQRLATLERRLAGR